VFVCGRVPLLYVLLLWASRDALRTGIPTSLSGSTAFLSAGYTAHAFFWEPFEMCRKLALTGWLLLIEESFEQARVMVAILVSVFFMAIHIAVKPFKRCAEYREPHSFYLIML
jgi:hypothetical protein